MNLDWEKKHKMKKLSFWNVKCFFVVKEMINTTNVFF